MLLAIVSQPCHARYDAEKWFVVRLRPVFIVMPWMDFFFAKLPELLLLPKILGYEICLPCSDEALQIPKLTLPRLLLRSKQNTLVHKILIMYHINDKGEGRKKNKTNDCRFEIDPDISIKKENKRH